MSTEDGWPLRGLGLLSLTREKKQQTTKRKAARCEGDSVCVGINESFDISKRLRHSTFPTQSLSPDTTWQPWTSGSLRSFALISGKKSRGEPRFSLTVTNEAAIHYFPGNSVFCRRRWRCSRGVTAHLDGDESRHFSPDAALTITSARLSDSPLLLVDGSGVERRG